MRKAHASEHNTEIYRALWLSGHNFNLFCLELRVYIPCR